MPLSLYEFLIELSAAALDLILIWTLLHKDLWSRVPALSAFICFDFFDEIASFYVYGHWPRLAVSRFYFTMLVIEFVFTYFLVVAFWKHGLRGHRGLWWACRWILCMTFVLNILVVAGTTLFGQGASPSPGWWLGEWIRLMARSVEFTQAAFLLAFFALVGHYCIRISSVIRGLAVSWFVYSLGEVALHSWRYVVGAKGQAVYSMANTLLFLALLGSWSIVLWVASPEREVEFSPAFAFRTDRRQLVAQMERVNQTLIGMWQA